MRRAGATLWQRRLALGLAVAIAGCAAQPAPEEELPRKRDRRDAAAETPYMEAAQQAATWLRRQAVETEDGLVWPADPYGTATVSTNLYTGTPGVVLFMIEMYRHTRKKRYRDQAIAGADYLMAQLQATIAAQEAGTPIDDESLDPTMTTAGLYTGLAGVGFVLNETYHASGDGNYRAAAKLIADLMIDRAADVGAGVQWVDSTDIVSGLAGTGLYLLYLADQVADPSLRTHAMEIGDRLIEQAEQGVEGLAWRINAEYPRVMPNFSHGTAGVAYFLARLYEETEERRFLEAARSGAEELLAIAETEGDICLVFHHTPGGEDLFYLSWCHGPAGTARTFYKLYQVTGDTRWMDWTRLSASGVYQSGIPEERTDGYWNNVGQCCGAAGVAEFSLAMSRLTGEDMHLEFAQRVADDILSRAQDDSNGLMWIQAEHRTQPEFLVAQTGYMQGAAGIGIVMLHLDAALRGEEYRGIVFPDSPY